ncbi:PepSY domain-containing protein [Streptomyces sp. NPDC003247]|uniref:PepSY domain-containing protein n=1 Tax=Streptomyces sp. NPDC003247 TaxID=3364677 RepID=UPI0036AAE291
MKRKLVIAAVTATAVIGAGTAVAFADDDAGTGARAEVRGTGAEVSGTGTEVRGTGAEAGDAQVRTSDSRSREGTAKADDGTARLTAAQAVAAALEARPGTALSVELDDDGTGSGSGPGWEVDVLGEGTTSYTVRVDPSDGRILGTETDRDDDADADDTGERRLLKGAGVTAAQAAEAAAARGVVTSVDLDDDGTGSWEVETTDSAGREHDWTVGLKNAEVTADRHDTDADDAHDAHDTDGSDLTADHDDHDDD